MKPVRRLFRILLIILLMVAAAGCVGPETRKAGQVPAKSESGFMWQVTGPRNTVYLMGSIHVARPDMYPLPARIETAFNRSPVLVVEADPEKLTPALSGWIQANGFYPNGERLSDHIRPETLKLMKDLGIDATRVDRMKPWLAALTIQFGYYQNLGYKYENGIDVHFLNKARGIKTILEIEGAKEQMAALHSLLAVEQESFIHQTLLELERSKSLMNRMIACWQAGDDGGLYSVMYGEYKNDPESEALLDKMLYQRNRRMAERIEGYLKSGRDHFVVVGAAHLVGPKGILTLLRSKGYHAGKQK